MKKIISIVAVLALGAGVTFAQNAAPVARQVIRIATGGIGTNAASAATDLSGGAIGDNTVFVHVVNSGGTETQSIAFATAHTAGAGYTTLAPGASITFGAQANPFIPPGIYARNLTAEIGRAHV